MPESQDDGDHNCVPVPHLEALAETEGHAVTEPESVPQAEADGERVYVEHAVTEAERAAELDTEADDEPLRVPLPLPDPVAENRVDKLLEGEDDTESDAVPHADGDADPEDVAVPLTVTVAGGEALLVGDIESEAVFAAVGEDVPDSEGDPEEETLPVKQPVPEADAVFALLAVEDTLCVGLSVPLSVAVLHAVGDGVPELLCVTEVEPVGDSDGEFDRVKLGEPELHAEVEPVLVALSQGDGVPEADKSGVNEPPKVIVPLIVTEGDPDNEPDTEGHPL